MGQAAQKVEQKTNQPVSRGKNPDMRPTMDWIGQIFNERFEHLHKSQANKTGRAGMAPAKLARTAACMLVKEPLYIKNRDGEYVPCWPLKQDIKDLNKLLPEERMVKACALILADLENRSK